MPPDGEFELVTLRNGARAVRDLGSGEVMHPSVGPWAEANRLYVEQLGLVETLRERGAALRIFDVGLGAGTNALAALEAAQSLDADRRRGLEVVSFERSFEPLRLAHQAPEGFPHQARWHHAVERLLDEGRFEADGLRWLLIPGDLPDTFEQAPGVADLVYFDPFSPKSNPGLWTVETFTRLHRLCRMDERGAVLATYSAATPTRVALLLAGFFVGAGWSIGTKRETTVAATRLEGLLRLTDVQPLGERWLERWERSNARAPRGSALTPDLEARLRAHPQLLRRSS